MNVIPKVRIYRSLQQRAGQLAPCAWGHPSSYAPGTPPALRGPLVRQPFSPAVPSAPGACPALPDHAVQRHAPASAQKSGFGCLHPSHPPRKMGYKGAPSIPALPCPAVLTAPGHLNHHPEETRPQEPVKHRSFKCSSGRWPQKHVCSRPLGPASQVYLPLGGLGRGGGGWLEVRGLGERNFLHGRVLAGLMATIGEGTVRGEQAEVGHFGAALF